LDVSDNIPASVKSEHHQNFPQISTLQTFANYCFCQSPDGHWVGVNVNTNKEVIIKSADRLCGVYHPKPNKVAKGAKKDAEPSNDANPRKNSPRPNLAV